MYRILQKVIFSGNLKRKSKYEYSKALNRRKDAVFQITQIGRKLETESKLVFNFSAMQPRDIHELQCGMINVCLTVTVRARRAR